MTCHEPVHTCEAEVSLHSTGQYSAVWYSAVQVTGRLLHAVPPVPCTASAGRRYITLLFYYLVRTYYYISKWELDIYFLCLCSPLRLWKFSNKNRQIVNWRKVNWRQGSLGHSFYDAELLAQTLAWNGE